MRSVLAGFRPNAGLVAAVPGALAQSYPAVSTVPTTGQYQEWLLEQEIASATFTPEQVQWLDAVKDHITSSLRIDQDSFDDVPFNQMGGLGRAHELFGEQLSNILEELS